MGNSSSTRPSANGGRPSGSAQRRPNRTESGPQPIPGRSQLHTQMISDQFTSLPHVTQALRRNGLESSNLIIGIDFTKSNEWSGKRTFGGRSLHSIDDPHIVNPYEEVIDIIGKTLRDFDEDNIIPVYGFGDEMTGDHSVFTFAQNHQPGFPLEQIRARYREIVPNVVMAGPTSFAPIINEAVNIVNRTGEYHILVIIADGQVTRSVDVPAHAVSKNEKETIDAITNASNFPLSIVMVGVGDGPWDSMIYFDNYLVHRKFDNFQFVEFHKIASQYGSQQLRETQFALQALMEIPDQYAIIKHMKYLSKGPYRLGQNLPRVEVYPPPQHLSPTYNSNFGVFQPARQDHSHALPVASGNQQPSLSYDTSTAASYSASPVSMPSAPLFGDTDEASTTHTATTTRPTLHHQQSRAELELSRLQDELMCMICEERRKDTVFQCGHETCQQCSMHLTHCPTCRQEIQVRIKRFG